MPELPEIPIESVTIQLKGFTIEEIEDIVGYIRSVEDHRPTRLVFIVLDTPTLTVEEGAKLVRKLYPP